MRLFLAVPLSEDARAGVRALVSELPELPGRAVNPENWHLTLRFLGSAAEDEAKRLTTALENASLGQVFDARLQGLGAFPRASRAAVVWLGVEAGADPLDRLAAQVEAAVQSAGFPPESRPFHAHLTLARLRPKRDIATLIDRHTTTVPLRVDRVVLYRSHLGRGGPRYEALEEFPLE